MIGAGEYTMGIGLTALVLPVLIKEKSPCHGDSERSPNTGEKVTPPGQQER
jgi:hypothetical protein